MQTNTRVPALQLVEELVVRRSIVRATDVTAHSWADDGDGWETAIEPVQTFPIPASTLPGDIWSLFPERLYMDPGITLSSPQSTALLRTIARYDRYIATLATSQMRFLTMLFAAKVLRKAPQARVAVFYAYETDDPFQRLGWDHIPFISSMPAPHKKTELAVFLDQARSTDQDFGTRLELDADMEIIICDYLRRIVGRPDHLDQLLIFDLLELRMLKGSGSF